MRSVAPSKRGYIMPEVKVRFPPEITPINLIDKAVAKLETSGETSRIPNAFIAYRIAFCKELRLIKHPVITQPQLSALVKQSWLKEEEHVRREYRRIAKEAKDLYIQICHERSPLFVTSKRQNTFSIDGKDDPSSNTNNNSNAFEFVFSNSSNLSDLNFKSLLPSSSHSSSSKQPVTKGQNITTSNAANIFNTDSPVLKNDNYVPLDFKLDTQFIDNLTPEISLFSPILSIQSDFPFNFDNSNSTTANNNVESSVASDNIVSSIGYNKDYKEKIGVLENRVVELEKKLESLTKLISDRLDYNIIID
ncbi:5847_t:CDS:1 [Ambispora gerdemannii]|uniref:5847_t:CDS:1 n=1 Tax=Ambispora gerdemannii TaxID=144530 RepID=A0A9N9FZL1_9GLOM|nr:5847_t:CDS:1 [Ambispora gerdemannii]